MSFESYYRKRGKRLFDFSFALAGLVGFAGPMVAVCLGIRSSSGKPIFFRQKRVGKDGRLFEMMKFRTMRTGAENKGTVTVGGDDRITPIGRLLRKTKIDELPQLINVLKGEMSFVGPRPDVPGYADKLTGNDRRILDLRPGITGPATLAYRNEEDLLAKQEDPIAYNDKVIFPDKVQINLRYLEECSLKKDLEYIVMTVLPIL